MPTIAFHRSQFRVAPGGRHLITGQGQPFVWLADSVPALVQRLDRAGMDLYLRARAAQRFTVIQVAVLSGRDALRIPNAYGLLPCEDGDITRLAEGYIAHLDHLVLRANALGVAIAIQPAVAELIGTGLSPGNVAAFTQAVARRYRDQAVMWVVGGGEGPEDATARAVWGAMGTVLREESRSRQLIAYLPSSAPTHGAPWAQAQSWMDLALHRSGLSSEPWTSIATGYATEPIRPLLDGDPAQEDQPVPDGETDGRLSAHQERMSAYRSVFAGACGHTYANHSVSCFHRSESTGDQARTPWQDALHDPAAEQMHYLRLLVEARPFQSRVPDQSLLPESPADPARHQRATRGDDDDFGGERGSYAFIYTPTRQPVTVDLTRLTGSLVEATWFDPRTGRSVWIGQFPVRGKRTFSPPGEDDWVLVLDDSAREYQPVGHAADRSMTF
jgi:hypothetical protein